MHELPANRRGFSPVGIAVVRRQNRIEPQGVQIKPGVWVAGARIHRKARIVAPAYIGAYARVRALAVVTRASVIERNTEIDCGTVIRDSTILPFSQVGAGLDVSFSVVGFRHVFHLQRQVDVEIADESLVDMASTSATVRALSDMLSLALYMPKALFSNLREERRDIPASLPEAIQAAPPSLSASCGRTSRSRRSSFCTRVDVYCRVKGSEPSL